MLPFHFLKLTVLAMELTIVLKLTMLPTFLITGAIWLSKARMILTTGGPSIQNHEVNFYFTLSVL